MAAVGSDKRIGRAFLNAGRGYGGGCFPKDVSGLISSATDFGVDMPIMTAATDVNESMPGYIASRVEELLGESLHGKKVTVLGLSFKAGTSDARKSPGVKLANLLVKAGAKVSAYDPHAMGEAKEELHDDVILSSSTMDASQESDALIVATDWQEFKDIDLAKLASNLHGNLFVDAMNCFDKNLVKKAGLNYLGIGRQ